MTKLTKAQCKRIAELINNIECTYIMHERHEDGSRTISYSEYNAYLRADTLALYDEFGIVLPCTERYVAERARKA